MYIETYILFSPSVSAIKILEESNKRETPIYNITKDNITETLEKLGVSGNIKRNVTNAVREGKTVSIIERNIEYGEWIGTGYIVLDTEKGLVGYMISGGLSGGSTSNVVELALIANLAMIIIDIVQAVALLSTGPVGVALGIIFIGSGIHQTMSQIDYYKSGNDDQIIKDAVIGVATTGGLVALKKLAKHLKLLKGACFTGDTKVLTEEGYKEIEEGEKVESFNEDTGEKKLKKVTGVEITEIEELLESPEKVYNLTIEDFHTYVVSEESVVVHNKCDLPSLKVAVKLSDEVIEHSVSNQSRLQHAYKHASDLGFGNWNKENSLLWKDYIIALVLINH